jgi:putative transcriptional regulator
VASRTAGHLPRRRLYFRSGSDEHSPRALPDEDCICLAVLDAPLKFTGWKHRWMNPFLRLQAG